MPFGWSIHIVGRAMAAAGREPFRCALRIRQRMSPTGCGDRTRQVVIQVCIVRAVDVALIIAAPPCGEIGKIKSAVNHHPIRRSLTRR